MNWNDVRKQFPILERYTYFNTARFCALPQRVTDLQQRYIQSLQAHGSWHFSEWMTKYEEARSMAASVMGCPVGSTFFLPNVSTGINLASLYLKDRPVVVMETDFPSVLLPWQTNKHPIETIPRGPAFYDQLHDSLAAGNKLLSISWVQSADGFELDLNRTFEWCKQYNCTLILDGTQGLGAIPFEMDPEVSMVFLSSSFKWLLAGYGVAVGYVSDDLLPTFKAFQGWNSIDFGTGMAKTGAASLEVGNALFLNVLGLYEGLSLILDLGVDEICERNIAFRDALRQGLESQGRKTLLHPDSKSSIFRLETERDEYDMLVAHDIQTSKQSRGVRLSPHFYNTEEDMDRFLDCIGKK